MCGTSRPKSHPMSLGRGVREVGRSCTSLQPASHATWQVTKQLRVMISFASFLIYLMSKKINQADSHPGGFEPQLLTVPLFSQPIL